MMERQSRLRASFWHLKLCLLSEERTFCFGMSLKGTEIGKPKGIPSWKIQGTFPLSLIACKGFDHSFPLYVINITPTALTPASHTEPWPSIPAHPVQSHRTFVCFPAWPAAASSCVEKHKLALQPELNFHITRPHTDVFKLNSLPPGWIFSPFVNVTDVVT